MVGIIKKKCRPCNCFNPHQNKSKLQGSSTIKALYDTA